MSTSAPSSPLLGTPYLTSQSTTTSNPKTLISPSLCQNLTQFKQLLRSSRSLDDSITTRLNRATALTRSTGGGGGGECELVWRELSQRWGERNRVLSYCDLVLEGGEGRDNKWETERGLSAEKKELGRGRSTELELKRNQLHQEFSIEQVIRHRTIGLLFSKCPGIEQRIQGTEEREVVKVPRAIGSDREEEESKRRRGRDERGRVRWA